MYGWLGKVLLVDLTRGELRQEPLDPRIARNYIGGRGLGIHYLRTLGSPTVEPLEPDNPLIMSTGPLTGTKAPTGARYMVTTKSPLTGAITCANSGGHFPAMMKRAGFDAIIFTGAAPEPVYLWINNGEAELRPAGHLWGQDTHQTHQSLAGETHPQARTACIGPAGENRVLFAAIMNDKDRAAGRSGVGAVMGAKKLKAVAVFGEQAVPLHDPEGMNREVARLLKVFKDSYKDGPPPLRVYGTAITATATNNYGVLPTRNCRQGTFEGADNIGGQALTERFLKKPKACFSCPIACGRDTAVEEGPYQGAGEGPEYETLYALGSACGVDDLAAITKANYICNEMGMDTITMGATIACAMELYEAGYLPESDVGRPLRFGDAGAVVELTSLTAARRGFGELLAQGSLRLATRYGHPELAMVAKGQEFAGYDPRGVQGMGLAYATSPIGASHMRGDPAYIELLGVPKLLDPLKWEGKAQLIKDWQDVFCVIDASGLCVFFSVRNLVEAREDIAPSGITKLLNLATGADYTLEEVIRVGERIFNAERIFLNQAGFSREQDTLPPRILSEPMPDGPARGMVCQLEPMLTEYYTVRGWSQQGLPQPEILGQLGLI
ncbi:MAG: aldehyde ferredoxin oxidoreductase family protein [Proteobacteria bacterium]|nr:aldehyde ferredoxin oxidoreductase family protein [Pseudomonadota bacterium]MBU4575978.1 aldehyde ferredoxin oxidoreductase family protein [Pseudomonadota bacterium]MBU4599441.1 aldehyde ferredoxin oxidoreductase family protein [Pseudomonadota bacterium]